MKILRLVLSIGPTSAPYNQFTLPLLNVHDVTLCTYFPSDMDCDHRVEYVEGNGRLYEYVQRLYHLLRNRPFDVVHIHSPHLALLFLLIALLTRPGLLSRSILHVHSSYNVYRFRNRWMLLPGFLAFGRIICCGHASRESFPVVYRLLAGRRLQTICNGVDLERVDASWKFHRWGPCKRDRDLRLIAVGSLRSLKNHATLIQGLARARATDVALTIVGEGTERAALQELAERLGVSQRVRFAGRVARDEALRMMWDADGFISLSRGEGLPVAVLEAMSCFCPVLLSDIPAHREIRGRRRDLIPLVDPNDAPAVARTIDTWGVMPLDLLRAWAPIAGNMWNNSIRSIKCWIRWKMYSTSSIPR